MTMLTSPWRFAAPAVVLRLAFASLGALCLFAAPACTGGDPNAPGAADPGQGAPVLCVDLDGDGFGDGCPKGHDCDDADPAITDGCYRCTHPGTNGCACDHEGDQLACGEVKETYPGFVLCGEGMTSCVAGKWSKCVFDHEVKVPDGPSRSAQGLSDAQACADAGVNLCDPYCNTFSSDTPTGLGNDAGLTADEGGLTLTIIPSDGGSDAADASDAAVATDSSTQCTSGTPPGTTCTHSLCQAGTYLTQGCDDDICAVPSTWPAVPRPTTSPTQVCGQTSPYTTTTTATCPLLGAAAPPQTANPLLSSCVNPDTSNCSTAATDTASCVLPSVDTTNTVAANPYLTDPASKPAAVTAVNESFTSNTSTRAADTTQCVPASSSGVGCAWKTTCSDSRTPNYGSCSSPSAGGATSVSIASVPATGNDTTTQPSTYTPATPQQVTGSALAAGLWSFKMSGVAAGTNTNLKVYVGNTATLACQVESQMCTNGYPQIGTTGCAAAAGGSASHSVGYYNENTDECLIYLASAQNVYVQVAATAAMTATVVATPYSCGGSYPNWNLSTSSSMVSSATCAPAGTGELMPSNATYSAWAFRGGSAASAIAGACCAYSACPGGEYPANGNPGAPKCCKSTDACPSPSTTVSDTNTAQCCTACDSVGDQSGNTGAGFYLFNSATNQCCRGQACGTTAPGPVLGSSNGKSCDTAAGCTAPATLGAATISNTGAPVSATCGPAEPDGAIVSTSLTTTAAYTYYPASAATLTTPAFEKGEAISIKATASGGAAVALGVWLNGTLVCNLDWGNTCVQSASTPCNTGLEYDYTVQECVIWMSPNGAPANSLQYQLASSGAGATVTMTVTPVHCGDRAFQFPAGATSSYAAVVGGPEPSSLLSCPQSSNATAPGWQVRGYHGGVPGGFAAANSCCNCAAGAFAVGDGTCNLTTCNTYSCAAYPSQPNLCKTNQCCGWNCTQAMYPTLSGTVCQGYKTNCTAQTGANNTGDPVFVAGTLGSPGVAPKCCAYKACTSPQINPSSGDRSQCCDWGATCTTVPGKTYFTQSTLNTTAGGLGQPQTYTHGDCCTYDATCASNPGWPLPVSPSSPPQCAQPTPTCGANQIQLTSGGNQVCCTCQSPYTQIVGGQVGGSCCSPLACPSGKAWCTAPLSTSQCCSNPASTDCLTAGTGALQGTYLTPSADGSQCLDQSGTACAKLTPPQYNKPGLTPTQCCQVPGNVRKVCASNPTCCSSASSWTSACVTAAQAASPAPYAAATVCGTADTDGDGYIDNQDCAPCDPMVNAGAFDWPGNGVDDDCSGSDALPADLLCDTGLSMTSTAGADFAKAMELCKFTTSTATGAAKTWGVYTDLNSPQMRKGSDVAGSPPDSRGYGIQQHWGTNAYNDPQTGAAMTVISTGSARYVGQANYVIPQTGLARSGSDSFTTAQMQANFNASPANAYPGAATTTGCSQGSSWNDSVEFYMQVRVPTNAKGYTYKTQWFTAEYPEWTCSPYNDVYLNIVEGTLVPATSPYYRNVLWADATNHIPITVNCSTKLPAFFPIPGSPTYNNAALAGTGFGGTIYNSWGGSNNYGYKTTALGGSTGWLTQTVPVTPGEVIKVKFITWDSSDQYFDSTALIDSWSWLQAQPPIATTPGGGSIPPPSAPAYVASATFDRDYAAVCPSGTGPVWGLWTWASQTPDDSYITFFVAAASTQAALSTTPVSNVVFNSTQGGSTFPYLTGGGADGGTTMYTGLDDQNAVAELSYPYGTYFADTENGYASINYSLQKAGLSTYSPYLRIRSVLHASSNLLSAPTLSSWNLTYQCVPNQ